MLSEDAIHYEKREDGAFLSIFSILHPPFLLGKWITVWAATCWAWFVSTDIGELVWEQWVYCHLFHVFFSPFSRFRVLNIFQDRIKNLFRRFVSQKRKITCSMAVFIYLLRLNIWQGLQWYAKARFRQRGFVQVSRHSNESSLVHIALRFSLLPYLSAQQYLACVNQSSCSQTPKFFLYWSIFVTERYLYL
jgi:hypothetical protein